MNKKFTATLTAFSLIFAAAAIPAMAEEKTIATNNPTATVSPKVVTGPGPVVGGSPRENVGKVTAVSDKDATVTLGDGTEITMAAGTLKTGDYALIRFSGIETGSAEKSAGVIDNWFYNEFKDTTVTFDIPEYTDYTKDATRLDFTKMIYNYLVSAGKIEESTTAATFEDCKEVSVGALAKSGIIKGITTKEFFPEANLTREQAAAIIARVSDLAGTDTKPTVTYKYKDDTSISGWAKDSVYRVYGLNLMKGSAEQFSAAKNLSLQEALAVILRANNNGLIDKSKAPVATATPAATATAAPGKATATPAAGKATATPAATAAPTATPTGGQIANPIKTYSTLAEMNDALKTFKLNEVTDSKYSLTNPAYSTIDDKVGQIDYSEGAKKITVRCAEQEDNMEDISGVYGGAKVESYKLKNPQTKADMTITIMKYNEYLYAYWTETLADGVSYSNSVTIEDMTIKATSVMYVNTTELKALVKDIVG